MNMKSNSLSERLAVCSWSLQPASPADLVAKRPDRAEIDKLTTPERIDKMKALHTQHMNDMNAAMATRGEATKAFYATLTPEQQKVFDANAMRQQGRHGWHHGPRGGNGPAKPAQ